MNHFKKLLRNDRIRSIERPFGWIPRRLVTSGLLADLDPPEKLLYFFLASVADPVGISFYGDRRLGQELRLSAQQLSHARSSLARRDLIAVDRSTVQLLSLPPPLVIRSRRSIPQTHCGLQAVGTILENIIATDPTHNARHSG
jgi:hypothetical protein